MSAPTKTTYDSATFIERKEATRRALETITSKVIKQLRENRSRDYMSRVPYFENSKIDRSVITAIESVTGIEWDIIIDSSRITPLRNARYIVAAYLRNHTNTSLVVIGKLLGGRTHASVISMLEAHKTLMLYDQQFKAQNERFLQIVTPVNKSLS